MHAAILTAQLNSPASDATVVEVLHANMTEARGFEGCLGVEALVDLKDPSKVTLITRWESQEANNTYLAWRQGDGAAGATRFRALLAGVPTVSKVVPAPDL